MGEAIVTNRTEPRRVTDAALYLADLGYRVFPCRPDDKRPAVAGWPEVATSDADEVEALFGEVAGANVGLSTAGLVVVDVDGEDNTWPGNPDDGASLHGAPVSLTPSGGRHYIFRAPEGASIRNSIGVVGARVDIRADGGYVVAPPSTLANGVYRWAEGCDIVAVEALPIAPGFLLAQIATGEHDRSWAAGDAIREPGRNSALYRIGCHARRAGAVPGELAAYLGEINRGRCVPPLPDDEVEKIVESCSGREPDLMTVADVEDHFGQRHAEAFAPRPDIRPDLEPEVRGSEIWMAREFVSAHGRDLRYVGPWKKWYRWDQAEGRWRMDTDGEVERRAMAHADQTLGRAIDYLHRLRGNGTADGEFAAAVALVGKIKEYQSRRKLAPMLTFARSVEGVAGTVDGWDRDPYLLNVANGSVDLRTGKIKPHDRADMVTKRAPVRYDPAAPAPRWDRFLREILPDAEVREYLQRAIGYAATGAIREHVLHFLVGGGANGKSTFVQVVRRVLGDYAGAAPPNLLVRGPGGDRHPTELASLHGRRLVVASETTEGGRLDENLAKSLTGGDAISARRMREDFWEFQPSHKLWLCTNHRPRIVGTDHGIWRRLILVPFEVTIPADQIDTDLESKLLDESEGVLRWIIEGAKRYLSEGLAAPAQVTAATESYRMDEDEVGDFLAERTRPVVGGMVSTADMYRAYSEWAEANGIPERRRLGQRTLTKRLRDRVEYHRSTYSRGWRGVALIDPFDLDDERGR